MKKLYEKSELGFALVFIAAYCILASVGDLLSEAVGCDKLLTLPILLLLSVILLLFCKKNHLFQRYGLCSSRLPAARLLFYIPLVLLLTANFWFGVALNATPLETVLYVLSMLCVGFLEEMIFRGLLFRAMAKNGVRSAIIVSALTFGAGHILNLFNGAGAELVPTLLQVVYALAVGFAFALLFYRSGSLAVCILTHGLFNAFSAFSAEAAATEAGYLLSAALITLVAGAYALYLALGVRGENFFSEKE